MYNIDREHQYWPQKKDYIGWSLSIFDHTGQNQFHCITKEFVCTFDYISPAAHVASENNLMAVYNVMRFLVFMV